MISPTKKIFSAHNRNLFFVNLMMIIMACVILYPFFVMILVSLKSTKEAVLFPNTIPTVFHFENYSSAWKIMKYVTVFNNTLIITSGSLVGIIILSSMASYIIATSKHKKIYNFVYIFFLCGIMIPFYTSLVPLVKLMTNLKLTNSLFGMILYNCGRNIPMAVFLYIGFVRGISREILEASRIDGANLIQIYWKVLMPMLKPITSTIIVLDALFLWNEFLFPRIMLVSSSVRTIALSQYYFTGEYGTKWELAFAAYMLTIIPVLIIYAAFQKNIIKGVAAGAVKG